MKLVPATQEMKNEIASEARSCWFFSFSFFLYLLIEHKDVLVEEDGGEGGG